MLTLTPSNGIRFRYRLDGFDTDWVDAGPRRTVFYTNLSPRDYRFRVQAHADDGTWSTSSAEWPFTIQPADNQALRIGQEAISNAVRHARARRIHLGITFGPESVTLRVEDDGCGFEGHRSAVDDSHYGLTTMRERAEERGGTLTIESAAGRGTSIEAVIPLAAQERNNLPAAI